MTHNRRYPSTAYPSQILREHPQRPQKGTQRDFSLPCPESFFLDRKGQQLFIKHKETSRIPVEAKYLASGGASVADDIVEDLFGQVANVWPRDNYHHIAPPASCPDLLLSPAMVSLHAYSCPLIIY